MTVVVNRVTVYQLSWGERLLPPTGLVGGGEGQIGRAGRGEKGRREERKK